MARRNGLIHERFGPALEDHQGEQRVRMILATMAMLPALTMLGNLVGILGGLIIGVTTLDLSAGFYWNDVLTSLTLEDVWSGLGKAVVFGYFIALVACRNAGLTLQEEVVGQIGHELRAPVLVTDAGVVAEQRRIAPVVRVPAPENGVRAAPHPRGPHRAVEVGRERRALGMGAPNERDKDGETSERCG